MKLKEPATMINLIVGVKSVRLRMHIQTDWSDMVRVCENKECMISTDNGKPSCALRGWSMLFYSRNC